MTLTSLEKMMSQLMLLSSEHLEANAVLILDEGLFHT